MIRNKLVLVLALMAVLAIGNVLGAVRVISNETSSITNNKFTATMELNESSTARFFISTNADGTAPFFDTTEINSANATTWRYTASQLTGKTDYYWYFNGTSGVGGGVYKSGIVHVVTSDYSLGTGIARTILTYVSLILAAFALLGLFQSSMSIDKKVQYGVITVIGILVFLAILNA